MSKELEPFELPEDYKFVYKIEGCEHKLDFDINTIVDKILSARIKKVDEEIIRQLRNIGEEKGINELILIDESKVLKMVKALKEYERYKPLIDNIQNGLTDTISVEDLKVLIKRSKALKIIRNKKVDIHTLYRDSNIIGDTFDYYNNSMLVNRGIQYELTQEEYDLLKEVLL